MCFWRSSVLGPLSTLHWRTVVLGCIVLLFGLANTSFSH